MANNVTDLGKVGITMKGEWSSSTAYERLDSVMYDGSLWIALADNTNSTPSINNSNWMLSAKHGEFTEQQLEDFKAEVVAESKEEMDEYTSDKKDELDAYTSGLESDFNTNASSKTTDFNNNATSKTGDFDSNASSKTTAFNTNASDETTAFNSNATSKTSDFNDNASSKTNAFNSNATEKTTAFDNNASAKTTAFNENATSKTTDFNTNATSKTGDFNDNATAKTTAFDEHVDDKIDEFDENAESLQQEIDELSANMPWAGTEQAISIDITDAAKYSKNKMQVFGNTEQTSYEGNQLFDIDGSVLGSNPIDKYNNGFSLSVETNRVLYIELPKPIPAGDYYLNFDLINSTILDNNNFYLYLRDNAGTNITTIKPLITKNINLTAEATRLYFFIANTEASSATITIDNVMLNSGNNATDWEPYTNGPAPNPDYPQDNHVVTGNNTVKISNSNVFDGEIELGTINYSSGKNGNSNTVIRSKNYIPVFSSTFKIISKNTFSSNHALGFRYYDKNYNYIGVNTASMSTKIITKTIDNSLDTTKEVAYMRFVDTSAEGDTTEEFAITFDGSEDYVEHQGEAYPVNLGSLELCKIGNYQDYIYKENGNWYKYNAIEKVVLNGSERWNKANVTSVDRFWITPPNIDILGYCNNFIVSTWDSTLNIITLNSSKTQMVINYSDYGTTTLEQFKAWLSTHNTTVYYVPITPTITQITDTTLIEQLEAIYNHLALTKGTNHITITAQDLAPYVTLNYMQDLPSKLDNLASRIELLEE